MEIVFYIGIVLFFLFGPWVLMARVNSRRKRERVEDQSRWSEITARVYGLERELRELRSPGSVPPEQPTSQKAAVAETHPADSAVPEATPSRAAAEAWVTRRDRKSVV